MNTIPSLRSILKNKSSILWILLLFGSIAFLLFGNLSSLPVREYDEARNSINALEMAKDHQFMVTHYEGIPDLWNTKPPLMIWCQVLCIYLFGPGEFAIRFPSAFAGLLTCILVFIFCYEYLKNKILGVFSALVLVTLTGYMNFHGTRTGDYDALLTLFTTAACLSYYLHINKNNSGFLLLFFLFLSLSVLTKGVSGLLFLPALFIYTIFKKKLITLFHLREFYVGSITFLFIALGYYLLREKINPGYFDAVYSNELGGRFLNTIENHSGDFLYYISNLIHDRLRFWYLLIPFGILIGFLDKKNSPLSDLTFFATLLVFSFLLIISFSQTKCYWYDIPLFPFFSILISLGLNFIYGFYRNFKKHNISGIIRIICVLVIMFIFYEPLRTSLKRTLKTNEETWDSQKYEISHFLQSALKGKYNLDNFYLVHDGFPTHLLFYIRLLNDKGDHFSFKKAVELLPGDRIIAHQQEVFQEIEKNYTTKILFSNKNVIAFQIEGYN